MITNNIVKKMEKGETARGCVLVFPSAELVDLLGIAGFDFIHVDGEHGSFSPDSVDAMCRAADGAGLTTTARVPSLDPSVINQFLDRGVLGIVGPHIETAEQARSLASACRFGPRGDRSWGAGRGTLYNDPASVEDRGGSRAKLMDRVNSQMLVVAQLETVTAIDNLEAILDVEGIDAFTYGPNDLAQSMGLPGQPAHADVVKLMGTTTARIHSAGRKMQSDIQETVYAPALILDAARRFLNGSR